MRRTTFSLLYLTSFVFVQSIAGTIPLIKPCKPEDNTCLIRNVQNAYAFAVGSFRELGFSTIDPYFIDSININDDSLKLNFENIKVYGFSQCDFVDAQRDTKTNTVSATIECPLIGKGQYHAEGNILSTDVYGKGDVKISSDKVKFILKIFLKIVENNGIKYFNAIDYDFKYEVLEKLTLDFQNLYDGDEARAKPLLDALNKNWKILVNQYGDPIIKKLTDSLFSILQNVLTVIPANQLEII